jgi:GxxExxY protein
LADRVIPFQEHKDLILQFKDRILETRYQPDFICFGKIIVEIKAVSKLIDEHRAQLHNYLKATEFKLRILFNFGQYPKLTYERIVR